MDCRQIVEKVAFESGIVDWQEITGDAEFCHSFPIFLVRLRYIDIWFKQISLTWLEICSVYCMYRIILVGYRVVYLANSDLKCMLRMLDRKKRVHRGSI